MVAELGSMAPTTALRISTWARTRSAARTTSGLRSQYREPGQFDGFFEMPSGQPGFRTPTDTAFATHSFDLASVFAERRRNGKLGAKTWGMKARRRRLSVTPCPCI